MLRYYFRLFHASSTDQLQHLAADISEYYKNQSKTNRKRVITMGHIQILTALELQSIIINTYGFHHQLSIADLYSFVFLTPCVPPDCSSFTKARTFISYAFNTFSFSQKVEDIFLTLGCPQKYLYLATSLFYSAIHVTISHLSIQSEIVKQNSMQNIDKPPNFRINLIRIIEHTLIFSATSYSFNRLIKLIRFYLPFLPVDFLSTIFAFYAGKAIQNIESFGLAATFENFAEKVMQFVLSKFHKDLPCLPIEYEVPYALQCPICHDILKDPKESLGFFFCSYCIDRYLKETNSPNHPLTREKLTPDMIHSCLIMNEVAYKFHKIALQDFNEQHGNHEDANNE